MNGFNRIAVVAMITLFVVTLIVGIANAQYWFQSGARAYNDAAFNTGASVSIKTVPQNPTNGTMAFWVGETLSNGAFIQVGYLINNATTYYNSDCGPSRCNSSVLITAGKATWFWEYFPANYTGSSFYGAVGPDGSAGSGGTFNNYSFKSTGNIWHVYFNNVSIGSVALGTGNSGPYPPSAIGEYVSNTNSTFMNKTAFRNLAFYKDGWHSVAEAYGYVGYGRGSEKTLTNTYGVAEVGDFANYFQVGSELPVTQYGTLWRQAYTLDVSRGYGGTNSSLTYIAGATATISVPSIVYLNDSVRERFVGWDGSGSGSYSGTQINATIDVSDNITEVALWQRQYYLNVTSRYGEVSGGGWYDANATAIVMVNMTNLSIEYHTRALFEEWNNGGLNRSTKIIITAPTRISALWKEQFLLVASTQYGNVTGGGWYDANATAIVSLKGNIEPIDATARLAFKKWSDGNTSETDSIVMDGPTFVYTVFSPQYLVTFSPQDAHGRGIYPAYMNVSSKVIYGNSTFLFSNTTYNVEYIYYKGTKVVINHAFNVSAPEDVAFSTPVYDVAFSTRSLFGTPVNASITITFKNKSSVNVYSGKKGLVVMHDVPYGYVEGTAEYIGLKQGVYINTGGTAYLTFFTYSIVIVVAAGIVFIAAVKIATDKIARKQGD